MKQQTSNYKIHLNNLKNNFWFRKGVKIAIAIGDDANVNVLEEFTGSKESVYTVHNIDSLEKIIRFVALYGGFWVGDYEAKHQQIEKQINVELKEELETREITTGGNSVSDDWE